MDTATSRIKAPSQMKTPLFVVIQVLNATIWGVVYAYARAKTGSIYPPMLLHAAMNLVVILF